MTSPAPAQTPSRSLVAGLGAALAGALVGAVGWAVLTTVSDYKIGFAAIGVGALAGFLAGKAGGDDPRLPFAVAAIAVLGCFLGDLLIAAHFIGKEVGVGTFEVFKEMVKDPGGFGKEAYKAGFEALDALFYALAGVAGFRLTQQVAERSAPPAPVDPPADPFVKQPES